MAEGKEAVASPAEGPALLADVFKAQEQEGAAGAVGALRGERQPVLADPDRHGALGVLDVLARFLRQAWRQIEEEEPGRPPLVARRPGLDELCQGQVAGERDRAVEDLGDLVEGEGAERGPGRGLLLGVDRLAAQLLVRLLEDRARIVDPDALRPGLELERDPRVIDIVVQLGAAKDLQVEPGPQRVGGRQARQRCGQLAELIRPAVRGQRQAKGQQRCGRQNPHPRGL